MSVTAPTPEVPHASLLDVEARQRHNVVDTHPAVRSIETRDRGCAE